MIKQLQETEIDDFEWETILSDLHRGAAVLLIGPEFPVFENNVHSYIHEQLQKTNKEDITHYYERDGLFQFASPESKQKAISRIIYMYQSMKSNQETLKRIAEIPFPLIVSLNPDHFLSEYFKKENVGHDFQFNEVNVKKEVELPTPDYPLIYNLFGSVTRDESLVLDYDDVYNLLGWSFQGHLPEKFRICYEKARTCIFLGFRFDRWYSHLLIRILNGHGIKGIQLAKNTPVNDESVAFIVSQFKIKVTGDQLDLLEQIYERYGKKYKLRETQRGSENLSRAEFNRCIEQGDFDKAINVLLQASKGGESDGDIISLKARYVILQRDRAYDSNYDIKFNSIIRSAIEYSKELLQ